ncbi:MAG: ATP-binding cassette domain-containing protein [Janthinobacterium lividum]
MTVLLDLRDESVGFAGQPVLRGIALQVQAGERLAIMGRSGAGKSTLLNLIYARLADQAALVPQASALVGTLSVFHNVYMGRLDRHPAWRNLRMLAWPAREEVAAVRDTLDAVGLADKLFARAGTLSGGQQQRTSIARALYNGRPVVIGDEPVSALDRHQGATVLRRMADAHATMILALHDVSLALEHASRIVVLEVGRIALDAPAASLREADLARFYG